MGCRKFSLFDAMILVAATAVGFGIIQTCSPEFYVYQYTPIPSPTWVNWLAVVLSNWAFYLSPLPAAWTLAALMLRLRHPRPPLRRLMRQPGAVSSFAGTMLILVGVLHYQIDRHNPSWHTGPFEYTTYSLGCGIGAVWLISLMSKRWRVERSWIDLLGRSLGVYWISMAPLKFFRTYGGW